MEDENVKEISYTVENIPGALYAKGEDEKRRRHIVKLFMMTMPQ